MSNSKIIILNGTSSSGKSTIAKAIQEMSSEKFYHVQIDTFISMMSEKFLVNDESIAIKTINEIATCMHEFVALLAKKGCNVIIDTVFENQFKHWLYECVELFDGVTTIFVKVNCSLEELTKREIKRKDRQIGLAKYQYDNMDFNSIYDIEVDTSKFTKEECSEKIMNYIFENVKNSAFETIHKSLITQESSKDIS